MYWLSIVTFPLLLVFSQSVEASDGIFEANNYHILMWLPLTTRSHYIVYKPLLDELARRGHRISMVFSQEDAELCGRPHVECATIESVFPQGLVHSSRDVFEGNRRKLWGTQDNRM